MYTNPSAPHTLYSAYPSVTPWPWLDGFWVTNPGAERHWGVFFPIIGFRCKPMQTYWLDAYNGTTAVLRWRSDGQDTLFNVRLVGEDGSDTTFVTSDTTITLTQLSDSVRYHVMLRKQCRYCTSNYDTTVYSDWTPGLYFGTTIPRVVMHTVTATSADYSMGVVTGGGVYRDSSLVTLTAYHFGGYDFDAWNDGDSANPRQFRVTCDTSFTAYFRVVADTSAVGILQPEDEDFLLRPNPAHGEVQILLPATAQGGQLAICDMAGRELMVLPVTSTAMKMDLGTLPQGTYLVKLTTATATTTKKLLVQ